MTSKAGESWIIHFALTQAQLNSLQDWTCPGSYTAVRISAICCLCSCFSRQQHLCLLSYRFCTFLWLCLYMKTPAWHRAPVWSQQSHGWRHSDSPSGQCRHQAGRYQRLLSSTPRIPIKQARCHSGMKAGAFLQPLGTNDFLSHWEMQQIMGNIFSFMSFPCPTKLFSHLALGTLLVLSGAKILFWKRGHSKPLLTKSKIIKPGWQGWVFTTA